MPQASSDSYTTYRGHARPRAFDAMRDEALRLILLRLPIGPDNRVRLAELRRMTGMRWDSQEIYRLRENDLRGWSDSRLVLLAERLGVSVTVGLQATAYARDQRVAFAA